MNRQDFAWVQSQAVDRTTRQALQAFEKGDNSFFSPEQTSPLRLGRWIIWLSPANPGGDLETYTEIFRDHAHSQVSGFPAGDERTIVDLGANEGFYVLFAKWKAPQSRILAVEPNPLAFEILERNIEENRLTESVILEQRAVGAEAGKVPFEIIPFAPMRGAHHIPERSWFRKEDVQTITVEQVPLPALVEEHDLRLIDLLKIDVEGSELDILRSSQSLYPAIKKIVVEYHTPELKQDVTSLLTTGGFRLLRADRDPRLGDLYFEVKSVQDAGGIIGDLRTLAGGDRVQR